MLDFKLIKNTNGEYIETSIAGKLLLNTAALNKETAFSEAERSEFNLLGKLPAQVETLAEQVKRAYWQFQSYATMLQKNIYLNNLHDKNQVLFYKLVSEHLVEILPCIYTPIVGTAVKEYSREFRQARGLYIAYPYRDKIAEILDNRSHPEIDLIVVTDGEGVLGIGDQGIGGMDIPIAKLMVYTLCAGINPLRTLPILLDVGTDNQELLADPLYLGLRHPRIRGAEYDAFIEQFVTAVQSKFPNVFLHWEDFGRSTARHILDQYKDKLCTFNDDIQGTGAVTLAAILAAAKATGSSIEKQRVVLFGAGTAGTGIADQICAAMMRAGLTEAEARQRFWLVDRPGLLLSNMPDLTSGQMPYAHKPEEVANWQVSSPVGISLYDTITHAQPTILIGCSTQGGAFKQEIIRELTRYNKHPIIFPLSNPTEHAEATPADILQWTNGQAIVATGSPFEDVNFNGQIIKIGQCNNALVFPGIGLGLLAIQAKQLTDDMLWAATQALVENAPVLKDMHAPVLPLMQDARVVARKIALAVAQQAQRDGLAQLEIADLERRIDELMWQPHYVPLRRT